MFTWSVVIWDDPPNRGTVEGKGGQTPNQLLDIHLSLVYPFILLTSQICCNYSNPNVLAGNGTKTAGFPCSQTHLLAHAYQQRERWWWWWFSRSVVSDLTTPRTIAHQAPLSMGFSRQEYWSQLPFPSPGHLPNSGIIPGSPALQADSLPTELWGKPRESRV